MNMRRAIALFVEDKPHLIANSRWLYESWKYIESEDTDLVFMGPELALECNPEVSNSQPVFRVPAVSSRALMRRLREG